MKNLLILLLLTTLALLAEKGSATTYYFSTTDGDDSRSTTQAQSSTTPWKTISKLNSFFSSLQPGDFVLFKRGDTFYGSITVSKSGSSGSPITLGAYGSGAKPVITGFTSITSWASAGSGLYTATVPAGLATLNMVTLDGAFQVMGKYPKGNAGYFTVSSVSGTTSVSSTGMSGAPNFVGGEIVWRPYHWVLWRGTVTAQTSSSASYTAFASTSGGPTEAPQTGYGFFFQNHPNACTVLGEWAYTSSSHVVTMYFGGSGSGSHAVNVSSIDNLIPLSGRSYITFDNLAITGANSEAFYLTSSNNISINACDILFSGHDAVNANSSCSSISVTNCNINYANFNGLVGAGSPSWTITGNTINNIAAVAGMGGSGEGQYFAISNAGNSSIIENNSVVNTGYVGINFRGTNVTIQNNFVDTFCTVKDDGGGIYCGGANFSGSKISTNIVTNGIGALTGTPDKDARTHGIYIDDGASNVEIGGNTSAFCAYSGIYTHNSYTLNIHDNTLFDNKTTGIKYYDDGNTIGTLTLTGNIFFAKATSEYVSLSSGGSASPVSFFTKADNNYWCRPLNENSDFQTSVPSGTYNLTSWKTFTGKETNSKITPMAVTNANNIRFEDNPSASTKVVNLGATYMDAKGTTYTGTITLAPYTSAVLLYVSGTVANQPPVANAGPDITITLPTNTVALNGSGTDPDGTIASYQWTKISGPSQNTIASPSQAQTAVNNLAQGVYQFALKVTDNSGAAASDTVQVTVNAGSVNQPPVANAGTDVNITLPNSSVTLTGSASDPDGTIASYQWTKVSGPSSFTITSPTQAQTSVTNLAQGIYKFVLKVTDNGGATAADTVQVTVNAATNQPPVANAGLDVNITLPANSVTLNGSGSDADGTVASYQWTKISGPSQYTIVSSGTAQTVVNNLLQGVYQFVLKVTDNLGAAGSDTVVVTVNAAPNQPPAANAGADISITLPTNTVKLLGSGTDPDGTISAYQWTKISGPSSSTIVSATSAQTTVNSLAQGVYQFVLKVTDNAGATATDTVQVTVNAAPVNQPPVANAGADINITLPTNSTTLSGSGTDADGTIASYQWTKISGPTQYKITSSRQAQTTITGLAQGIYQFQLKVTDNNGATGLDTVTVTVNAAANQPPVANAGPDITITLPVNSVMLNGSGSDPDGRIASYQWTEISGPSTYTFVSSTSAQTTVNNLVQGVYQFQLTVTDNQGATASDVALVTVNAAPVNQPPVANAGPDMTITLPANSVILNGSGSDPDGSVAAYRWTEISGPSTYTFVSSTSAQTTVNNLVQGVYQFQLTVTDNQGATASDVVTVTVNAAVNQPPVANAGPDMTITLPVNSVVLNGSGNDPDGSIATYQWTEISGPSSYTIVSATTGQTTVNNMVQGVYQFQLTVTDNMGATASATVTVTVNPEPNQPPVADAGADINITLPTNSVILNGSGNDPDGTVASYQWAKVSGPSTYTVVSASQAQTVVNNLVQGVYQFQLTVTDNQGATAKDTVMVTVSGAVNDPPVANAGADITITLPTNNVILSGSGNDPDGSVATYQWSRMSGPASYNIVSAAQAQTIVNNLVQGVYQFVLTVTDNQGAIAMDTVMVTVNTAANQPPVADAGADVTITLPTNNVILNGSGNDPDGNVASYRWSQVSGPSQYRIVSSTRAQTMVTGMVQGVYQFELKVTDNDGSSATDTVQITVNAAPVNQPPVANAGADISITLPVNSVTLSGGGTDADGTVVGYQWTKISGPSQYVIISSTRAQTAVNNLVQGTYSFVLRVTDNHGATDRDTVNVTVNAAPNQPPVANAGSDIVITLPVNSATLNGSASDPDGAVISYQWTQISGPSQYNFTSSTEAQTAVTNLVQGVYQFALTVTDNDGATATDAVQVTVNAAPNEPPTANAGGDISITLPVNSTTLIGSGSDADGTIVSYQWTKISGPSQYNISAAAQSQTAVDNLVQGAYAFALTVTDNDGATATDTVHVIVNAAVQPPNQAPTANAGTDISIALPTNSVGLNGSGTDVDGTIVSYQWAKISGPSQYRIISTRQAGTTVNNLVQGVYQFALTVTDNDGASGSDTVTVTVNPAPVNQPPVANAGADISITLPVNSIVLSGSGTDADGTIASYQWEKVSGPSQYQIVSATQAQTTVNNLTDGIYFFVLRVTDNDGASATDTVQVIVNPAPNQPPVANAGSNLTITLPDDSTTLNGSGNDPDGNIVSYQWTKISGPSQYVIASNASAQTSISNLVQGVYQFVLTVTDNDGAVATDTVSVTVNAAPNQPPIANAGPDITITLPTNSVTLNGGGIDPDGTVIAYQWTRISGPSAFNIVSAGQSQTVINNLAQGVYQFELTVTDNLGASAADTVIVTVNAAPNQPPVANAGADISITLPTNSVSLNGSATDPDGTVVSYQWTKVDGPGTFSIASPSLLQTAVNNLTAGVYQFELKVTDNDGVSTTDTVKVTVHAAAPPRNQAPIANAGPDIAITLPRDSVTLAGNGIDPDGTIASYQWTKIAGPSQFTIGSPASAQTLINGLVQGVYQFELKVTDNGGATATDTVQVTVNPKQQIQNKPPVANAGDDVNITLPVNSTILTGSGSDSDGTIAAYQWKEVSGPASYTSSSLSAAQLTLNDLVVGQYQFELTVTDNQGATAKDTVSIIVNDKLNASAKIYPNPATDMINIQMTAASKTNMTSLRIYDAKGVLVGEQSFMRDQQTMTQQVNISRLPNGVYYIEMNVDANKIVTLMFVKQ